MVDDIWMDENEAINLASCLPHYCFMLCDLYWFMLFDLFYITYYIDDMPGYS